MKLCNEDNTVIQLQWKYYLDFSFKGSIFLTQTSYHLFIGSILCCQSNPHLLHLTLQGVIYTVSPPYFLIQSFHSQIVNVIHLCQSPFEGVIHKFWLKASSVDRTMSSGGLGCSGTRGFSADQQVLRILRVAMAHV